jgi:hypothetical protein
VPVLYVTTHGKVPPGTAYLYITINLIGTQPRKSVTLRPQPGRETTKSIRDMWWHWKKNKMHRLVRDARTIICPVYQNFFSSVYSRQSLRTFTSICVTEATFKRGSVFTTTVHNTGTCEM